jgi:hypothetical protein
VGDTVQNERKIGSIEAVYLPFNTYISFPFPFEQFPINKGNITLPFIFYSYNQVYFLTKVFWLTLQSSGLWQHVIRQIGINVTLLTFWYGN